MKVKRIDLDDDEVPASVTVELTHDEAVYLAVLTGKQNAVSAEEVLRGGAVHNGAVYECLSGGLFNRFYEDGVDGAAAVAHGRG